LHPLRKFKPKKGPSRRFWRLLGRISPQLAKNYLAHAMRRHIRAVAAGSAAVINEPVTLAAFFRTHLGIAQTARMLATALRASGIDVRLFDCSDLVPHEKTEAAGASSGPPFSGTLVLCVNPPELYKLFRQYGPDICTGKRVIGYWWWELEQLPADWRRWAACMHEIWVSSKFLHDVFSRELPGKTVRLVPLPIAPPAPSRLTRADFGIPGDRFAVLTAFDLQSGWVRKNPEGAVEAFRRAFPDAGAAHLVLKVTGAGGAPQDAARLRALVADMPNVTLIDRFLPAADLSALISQCDALLSLHRAEGLGLFLAEAMWLGRPIVATGWSGVLQLIDGSHAMLVRFKKVPVRSGEYPWAPVGANWAEPDLDHAAECLRRLAADRDLRAELGRLSLEKARREFDLEVFRRNARALTGLENPTHL
jgi:glycosyltransferase involved in cell wall biosynthesis